MGSDGGANFRKRFKSYVRGPLVRIPLPHHNMPFRFVFSLTVLCVGVYLFRRRSYFVYMAQNAVLHDRAGRAFASKNCRDRIAAHRDLVSQQSLLRSSLVCNVVNSFNAVEGNNRTARDERRRILSLIARDFPYLVLKSLSWRLPDVGTKFINRTLTRDLFHAARQHAGSFGPGGQPIFVPHRKKVTLSATVIGNIYSHIMDGRFVQKLACGSNVLVLSTGETFEVPPVARKFLRINLWCDYAREHTDDNGAYNGGISRSDYLEIISTATNSQEKTYAALDQTKVRYGSENFEEGFRLVQDLCALLPHVFVGYEQTMKRLMTEVKKHCKWDLPSHLKTLSKCACHCLTHLFGGQGPEFSNECVECDGHPERCKSCEQGFVVIAMIQKMVDKVKDSGTQSEKALGQLQWRLNRYVCKTHIQYII